MAKIMKHPLLLLLVFFLFLARIAKAQADRDACLYAPCPAGFTEVGSFATVYMRIYNGPDATGKCAYAGGGYGGQCQYDPFTGFLVGAPGEGGNRFSCPVQGVQRPGDCDQTSTSSSIRPTPTPTRDQCLSNPIFRSIDKACADLSTISDYSGQICPIAAVQDVAAALAQQVLIFASAALGQSSPGTQQAAVWNSLLFAVVPLTIGAAALTAGLVAGTPITAAVVLGAFAEWYGALCAASLAYNLAGSLCNAGNTIAKALKCPRPGRRALLELPAGPSIKRQTVVTNPCLELLKYLPSEEQCVQFETKTTCDNVTEAILLDLGFPASNAETVSDACPTLNAFSPTLDKLCILRKGVSDAVPFCTVPEDFTFTATATPTQIRNVTTHTFYPNGTAGTGNVYTTATVQTPGAAGVHIGAGVGVGVGATSTCLTSTSTSAPTKDYNNDDTKFGHGNDNTNHGGTGNVNNNSSRINTYPPSAPDAAIPSSNNNNNDNKAQPLSPTPTPNPTPAATGSSTVEFTGGSSSVVLLISGLRSVLLAVLIMVPLMMVGL